ncbi:MAG: GAF domain-containing sensor histidine kinase [Anaerolineales bacterium]|nr:GAF domain-containing sensor histidine kinase [Anaerolineales bacterium]
MPSFEQAPNLDRLLAVAHELGSAIAMEQLLQRLTIAASELTSSEGASLLEFDENLNSLHFVAAPWLREQPLKDVAVPLDASIAGWVFGNNEPLVIQDVAKDPRHFKAVDQALNFKTSSLVAVPLTYQGNTIGVLEAVNKADNAHYTGDDVAILEILALYAAIALWNSNLEKRIQNTRNEFAELDRLKSNFVAITSHELRTPLGLILGHATFLRETIGEEQREPMEIIIRNATRLKEIIESLTEVDNYEAGVARIRQRLISVPGIVEDVVSSFQDMAASKNITLQADVCEEELPVEADANKIIVALSNLVRNAITFTNEGGHVLVKAEPVTGHARVSVSDDGIGIPAKDLPKVFERFFQVESHLTRRNTGMGLGLSVAKTMIELHGGRIWVESVEGKGSTFTFLLPVKPVQTKISEQAFKF